MGKGFKYAIFTFLVGLLLVGVAAGVLSPILKIDPTRIGNISGIVLLVSTIIAFFLGFRKSHSNQSTHNEK